jgi:DNA repair protein RecN (Recombination protein N)
MLEALSISDLAIIERLDLALDRGLTVITGETGAGKSILIRALGLVLGERAKTDLVRTGADTAQVQAQFDIGEAPEIRARLTEAGLDDGDTLIIRRVIARSGRHRIYVNGALVKLADLARIAAGLVDISGQHAHHSLLRPDVHLDLLDQVGGLAEERAAVGEAYRAVAAIDARIAALQAAQRQRAERTDYLQFVLEELDAAQLDDPNEEEQLEAEAHRLANVSKLRAAAQTAEDELYGARGAVAERLARALDATRTLADVAPELAPIVEELTSALAVAEDAAHTLGAFGRDLSDSPDRLETIETRLALFGRLRQKHGATLAEVIARRDALRAEWDTLEGADGAIEALTSERTTQARVLAKTAKALSAARAKAAVQFAEDVQAELADLAMAGAQISMNLAPVSTGLTVGDQMIGPRGADKASLLMSANRGSTLAPLHRIASGGELSRLMLAVKRMIAARDPVLTYIFDEVDTGVSGATAEAIGRKLKAVSRDRQAICITHLPQIAALGDQHCLVAKYETADQTVSTVEPLDSDGRVDELARLLGGAQITATTRANAAELLALGARS